MATLRQLEYALALQEHRNFVRAAEACEVGQPTLSTQLQKLEDELGIVLFDRSRKPVEPTDDGSKLLDQFRRVMRENDRIEEVVYELRGVVAGPYRLGIIPTMAPTILPNLVAAMSKKHPEVELRLEELTTQEIIARLQQETLDGGILATPLGHPKICEFPICREDFVVYHASQLELPTDKDGRVRLARLPLEKLVVMRDGHCLRTQTLDLCQLDRKAEHTQHFTFEAGSLGTLCRMVEQGPFFTVLPKLAAADLESRGLGKYIKPIAGSVPYRQIAIVAHRAATRRAIREVIGDVCAQILRHAENKDRRHRGEPVRPLR